MKRQYRVAVVALVIMLAIPVFIKVANHVAKAYADYDASLVKDRGTAPELANNTWLNANKPIRLADLRGQVVLLDFWRFDCSECWQALPAMKNIYAQYQGKGVQYVSIHSPETIEEHDINNVQAYIKQQDIQYPVAIDQDQATWHDYQGHAWPTIVLIDKQGHIRYRQVGSGQYDKIELVLNQLLAE